MNRLLFCFGYSTKMSFAKGVSSDEIKKGSILLIRKLYLLMQNLGPLPNDITLTMKLFYYNEGRWRLDCPVKQISPPVNSHAQHMSL